MVEPNLTVVEGTKKVEKKDNQKHQREKRKRVSEGVG